MRANDAAVVIETWQKRNRIPKDFSNYITSRNEPYGWTAYSEVTVSSASTAIVVTAKYGVPFSPSGRKALPYWKKRMGHRSFCQASKGRQSRPLRPPKRRTKRSVFSVLGSTIVEKKTSRPTR